MGITPKGVEKRIKDMIDGVYDIDEERKEQKAAQVRAKYEAMPEKDLEKELRQIEKQMLDAAKNLEFERAAELRDRLYKLREALFGVALPTEARQSARAGDQARRRRSVSPAVSRHLHAPLPFALRRATSTSRYFQEKPNADGQ